MEARRRSNTHERRRTRTMPARSSPPIWLLTLLIAPALLQSRSIGAAEPAATEWLAPEVSDVATRLTLRGTATVLDDKTERGLDLPAGAYAEWRPQRALSTDAGTLSMWVRPLWAAGDQQSHTFATFKWSGSDDSYFALSQGWWEPEGRRKLYVVLSNQQFVFCFMPWTFDYTLYLPNQWTMLGVTWKAGNPGYLRLFVDGKRICERKLAFTGGRQALNPVYLGSDRGSTIEPKGRPSDMVIKSVAAAPWPSADEEIHSAYIRGGGVDRSKWILAIAADDPNADVTQERRVIQDEDTGWASSKLEIQERIRRIKAAGFNVYMPCVWDGAHAFYSTSIGPVSPAIRNAAAPRYDPLAYLIELAHASGVAVHPWFDIARHAPGSEFPESYLAGAPQDAFNVQSKPFRDFIVALVIDAARRYDVDGINLDYVRAIGPCSNEECLDGYSRKYGRSLLQDWKDQEAGKVVPSLIEWNRSAVTDIVRRISDGARQAKPKALLTIDTVPFDHGRLHQGLDEASWLQAGLIDAMVDMSYDEPIDIDTLDRAMKVFTPARQLIAVRDYDFFGSTVVDRSGDLMSDYVRLIRTRWPGAGIAVYHYPHLSAEQRLSLGRGVFGQAAAPAWTR
jgi:uncharacterized lipoprotein YddW (UPF0748 family)